MKIHTNLTWTRYHIHCIPKSRSNSSSPGRNGRHFADGIYESIFMNENLVLWFEFHWGLFLKIQLTVSQHWLWWWLGTELTTSHYLKQCWPSSFIRHFFNTVWYLNMFLTTRMLEYSGFQKCYAKCARNVLIWRYFRTYSGDIRAPSGGKGNGPFESLPWITAWHLVTPVKSVFLFWRSGTIRWNMLSLTKWKGTILVVPWMNSRANWFICFQANWVEGSILLMIFHRSANLLDILFKLSVKLKHCDCCNFCT